MILDVLALFRTLLDLCLHIGRQSSRRLVQPMLTAACLTGVYTAVHVSQEGGIEEGLRVAFLENEQTLSARRRNQEQVGLQAELRQFASANRLIDQNLRALLNRAPGASRVQLNVIHNGVTGLTGSGLLRYDLTNIAARPGRIAGAPLINQPLSEWNEFLSQLIKLDCAFVHVGGLHSAALQARFEAQGAAAMLICPAASVRGKIMGAVFVVWDVNDPVPGPDEMHTLTDEVRRTSGQIAAILDLSGPRPMIQLHSE